MFRGVVHSHARDVLATYIPALPRNAYVICSGNFTVEATLRLNGYKGFIGGCDVSLFTCAIGASYVNLDLDLTMNVDQFPDLEPLEKYMRDPTGKAAAVAVAFDLAAHLRQKNAFQRRMYRAYIRRLDALAKETIGKLRERREILQIDGFWPIDGWEVLENIPPGDDHAVMAFPPTYSGDYQKMFAALEEIFNWSAPACRELVAGAEFAKAVTSRQGPWVILGEERKQDMEEITGPPVAQMARGASKFVYLYTNLETGTKLVRRSVGASSEPSWARLQDCDEITADSKLTIHEVPGNEAMYLRQVYLSVKPLQTGSPFNYVVCLDGKVVGVCMFSLASHGVTLDGKTRDTDEVIYMLSDLPVSSMRHQRLSKLVVMAAASKEMGDLLRKRTVQDLQYVLTTAFTDRPVSMKYRGPYKMHSRQDQPDGTYKLNYYAQFGQWNLQEAFARWFKNNYLKRQNQ